MFIKKIISKGESTFNDYCCTFDGTDDYIQLNDAFDHNIHTIACWVKINATSGDQIIFDNRDGNDDGICLKINSDEKVEYQLNDQDLISAGDPHFVASGVLETGVWQHIAAVHTGSLQLIFINGMISSFDVAGSDHDTSVDSTSLATIGKSRIASSGYLNGSIAELAIYNTSFDIPGVNKLYNNRVPMDQNEIPEVANLQAYYKFGDGDSDDAGTNFVRGVLKDSRWVHRIAGDELYTTANAAAIGAHANSATGWTASSSYSVLTTSSSAKVSYGSYALKMIFDVSTTGNVSTTFPATVGKIYRIRFLSKAGSWQDYGDSVSDLHLQVGNAAANGGSFNEGIFTDIDSGKFYTMAEVTASDPIEFVFYCRIVAVDGSDNAHLTFNHVGSNGSGTLWIGGLNITEVTGKSGEMINRTVGFTPDPPDTPQ